MAGRYCNLYLDNAPTVGREMSSSECAKVTKNRKN